MIKTLTRLGIEGSSQSEKGYWCQCYHQFLNIHFRVCVCVCLHEFVYTWATVHTWRSENNLRKSVLSFQHVGPRDQTQVIRLLGLVVDTFACWTILPVRNNFLFLFVWLFATGSHHVYAQISTRLCLSSARIKGSCHWNWLLNTILNSGNLSISPLRKNKWIFPSATNVQHYNKGFSQDNEARKWAATTSPHLAWRECWTNVKLCVVDVVVVAA